jgi:hypothetical protein
MPEVPGLQWLKQPGGPSSERREAMALSSSLVQSNFAIVLKVKAERSVFWESVEHLGGGGDSWGRSHHAF